MTETESDVTTQLYTDLLYAYLFDVISLLIVMVAAIFILIASIKLYKNYKVPGVNFIFYCTTGTLISITIYTAYAWFSNDENQLFEQITSIYFSALFLLGAYGFWQLTKYLIHEKSC